MENSVVRSPDTERPNRVPPGQQLTERWPVLHHGSVSHIDTGSWKFTISGLVEKERQLDYQEFGDLPHVKVFSDIHCVTGWSRLNNLWEGVSTAVLRELVTILPEARYVIVHGAGSFTTNLAIADFFAADALFAERHNHQALTAEHGAPVRLVVPRLYFWKSAKWATGIEFVKTDRPGFWESVGYHNHGDPWKEERYG